MLRALGVPEKHLTGSDAEKNEPLAMLGGKSARTAMQTLGTEWGRECIHPDLWVILAKHRTEPRLEDGMRVVYDDVRFDNEVEAVLEMGGLPVQIERPHFCAVDNHASENGIEIDLPVVVENTGNKEELLEKLRERWGEY